MNSGELQVAAVALAERPDVAAQASLAVNYAHRHLQRQWNWRCMEVLPAVEVAYPAGSTGVTVAADLKEVQRVWLVGTDGARTMVTPTSDREAQLVEDLACEFEGDPRWYERGLQLVLMWPPSGACTLLVDYIRFLPGYDADDDMATDWFSENAADVLVTGAAYWLLELAQEKSKSARMLQLFMGMAEGAHGSDQASKFGGMRGSYSPPLPGGNRTRNFWKG